MVGGGRVRPKLLFVSPVVPRAEGNGLAMRAGLTLEALCRDFRVTLLVIPVSGDSDLSVVPAGTAGLLEAVHVIELDGRSDPAYTLLRRAEAPDGTPSPTTLYPLPSRCGWIGPAVATEASARLSGASFDVIHVFRLYLAPFHQALGLRAPLAVLDLDDDEVQTHRRLAERYDARGRPREAAIARSDAAAFEALEKEALPCFDRIWVCSDGDRKALADRDAGTHIRVIPNGAPGRHSRPTPRRDSSRLLFVGTLSYFPNEDGVLFLVDEVLPRLGPDGPRPFPPLVAGRDPPTSLRSLHRDGRIELMESPADIGDVYDRSGIVVVPMLAGGGTRIKVLEAMARGLPVVATTIGVEGLAVVDGIHTLVANTGADFAAAIGRMKSAELRNRLVQNARELIAEQYAPEVVIDRIRAEYRA